LLLKVPFKQNSFGGPNFQIENVLVPL